MNADVTDYTADTPKDVAKVFEAAGWRKGIHNHGVHWFIPKRSLPVAPLHLQDATEKATKLLDSLRLK